MSTNKQAGAVSLFVVIFAMLLLTVVTVSFLRLMMNDLRQSSDVDLSQSAYDSAQAGVEDAKRALLRYQSFCATSTFAQCDDLANQLSTDECNEGLRIGSIIPSGTGEVQVRQSTSPSDVSLNQAYTCVTMKLNTDDVTGTVAEGSSKYLPLRGMSAFNEVKLSWFSAEDLTTPSTPISLTSQAVGRSLLPETNWPDNRPPLMRTQLIQHGTNFRLSDFDIVNTSSESNTNTLFLYPTTNGTSADAFVGRDIRKSSATDNPDADVANNSPLAVRCLATVASGGYSCSVTLTLPNPIGGGDRNAFLRLTPFYGDTHIEAQLSYNGTLVQFKGVQPAVDSTGRANDLFRRVESRVELSDPSFPYPEAAVDVSREFCKDFSVTDTEYIRDTCEY